MEMPAPSLGGSGRSPTGAPRSGLSWSAESHPCTLKSTFKVSLQSQLDQTALQENSNHRGGSCLNAEEAVVRDERFLMAAGPMLAGCTCPPASCSGKDRTGMSKCCPVLASPLLTDASRLARSCLSCTRACPSSSLKSSSPASSSTSASNVHLVKALLWASDSQAGAESSGSYRSEAASSPAVDGCFCDRSLRWPQHLQLPFLEPAASPPRP